MRIRSRVPHVTRSLSLTAVLVTLLTTACVRPALAVRAPDQPPVEWAAVFAAPRPAPATSGGPLTLRRDPEPGSPVVATVENHDDAPLGIERIAGPFVSVRSGDVEGWASVRDVHPMTMAIVLDPTTGATIARVPVGYPQTNVTFSPDGSHAVFSGYTYDESGVAYEVRTSDFAATRSIVARGRANTVHAVFYGGPDRALYAVVGAYDLHGSDVPQLAIVRVGEEGAPAEPPVLVTEGCEFVASADGRVGFVLHSLVPDEEAEIRKATIDVVDLATLEVRNTIALTGDAAKAYGADCVPSFDGSELYLLGDISRIGVVDTTTGKVVREIPTGWAPNEDGYLSNVCSGGRSLLVSALGCTDKLPEGVKWIAAGAASRGPSRIACAVDAGGARYGVDEQGTRLFRLGAAKAARALAIDRPDVGRDDQTLWPISLTASPDGSRLVLFVSIPDDTCGC
jgi:hypothetical protein